LTIQKLTQIKKVDSLSTWEHGCTDDGCTVTEIKSRIAIAKEAFIKRNELMTKSFEHHIKEEDSEYVDVVGSIVWGRVVWSVALYGAKLCGR